MLERLTIRNVGGLSSCSMSFGGGLTVLTGESGAGKSSVVRAVELAAGQRSRASLVRASEDCASVNAEFSVPAALALPGAPSDGRLTVRRELSRAGRGRSLLCDSPVSASFYASVMGRLVRIQSQFAQMDLLDAERRLAIVDACGATGPLLSELGSAFAAAASKEREVKEIEARRSAIESRYANASEVVPLAARIEAASGSEASIEREMAEVSRRVKAEATLSECLGRLTGGMSGRGLLDELESVYSRAASVLEPDNCGSITQVSGEGIALLRSAEDAVRSSLSAVRGARDALEELEARLGLLRKLKRMAGVHDEAELVEYCRAAAEGLRWLEESRVTLASAREAALALRRRASAIAMSLRSERKAAAIALSERVSAALGDLDMGGMGFRVSFSELPKLRRNGADEVAFEMFEKEQAQKNARGGRVDKIASGGELSRLLLALQVSMPDEMLPPTLVFDEVEAGLGGRAAVLAGMKLKALARVCQVILVTHEASIAALADAHYVVVRRNGESSVEPVEGEPRVSELARMLSGAPDMPEAREHARRLLE
ncbi:MAG: AAA family ATPase [Synergistaceae bacterium]|jgi:DNA repair protein RecN (Recombination protein N)|nr:AAA family ATPase [Synergistaceae bacterium]